MSYSVKEEKGTARPFVVTNDRDGSVVARAISREDAENIARNKATADHKDTGLDHDEVVAAGAAKSQTKSGVTDDDGNTRPSTPEEHAERVEAGHSDEPVVEPSNVLAEGDPAPEDQDTAPVEKAPNTETVKRADVKEAQPDVPPEHTGDAEKEAAEDPTEATDNEDVPADEPEQGDVAEKTAEAEDPNTADEPKEAAAENTSERLEENEAEKADEASDSEDSEPKSE